MLSPADLVGAGAALSNLVCLLLSATILALKWRFPAASERNAL